MSDYNAQTSRKHPGVRQLAKDVVDEYLQYMGYESTRVEFNRENSYETPAELRMTVSEVQTRFFKFLKNGERDNFFSEWTPLFSNLTTKIESVTKDKMRFYVEIMFATFCYRGKKTFDEEENTARMNSFKRFLETEGAELSQSSDFFPYCALVCIKNPTTHRAFKNIFTEGWEKSLTGKLKKFISKYYVAKQPRLFYLLKNPASAHSDKDDMSQERTSAEKKLDQTLKHLNYLEIDYRNLIDIASELIDALEDTVNGKVLTLENLDDIAKRMLNNKSTSRIISSRASIRPNRPAEDVIKPITVPKIKETTVNYKLNFEKIRRKIAERNEEETPLLLQAIRWRLTRADKKNRKEILQNLIANDILGCSKLHAYQNDVIECLNSPSTGIRQYMARLINSLASLARGRDYLTLSSSLLNSMTAAMQRETGDTVTRQHLIGSIQKLTLRRPFQREMIRMGLIQWIMSQLEDDRSLSEYSLEYGVALLMNLCLLKSGREVCVSNAKKYLSLLLKLLENPNSEIQPYIHGTMYTLLSDPRIKAVANKMLMEKQLNEVVKKSSSENAAQIHHIIRRLHDDSDQQAKSDDDEEADNSEDDPDVMEPDLNEREIVKAVDSRSGEELLIEKYSSPVKSAEEFYMSRPITPMRASSHVRQSLPTKPASPTEREEVDHTQSPPPPMRMDTKLQIKNHDDVFAARPRITRTPDVEFGRPS